MEAEILFKALSDETRLRCLVLLLKHRELCVCELTHAMKLAQPKVSHHLAALRRIGLVRDRKEGLWIHYSLNPNVDRWVLDLLRTTAEEMAGRSPYIEDSEALAFMPNRPGSLCCT